MFSNTGSYIRAAIQAGRDVGGAVFALMERIMSKQLSQFEKNTTTKTRKDGRTTIRCKKGLWAVTAKNKNQATKEAVHYFMQYWADGEYE